MTAGKWMANDLRGRTRIWRSPADEARRLALQQQAEGELREKKVLAANVLLAANWKPDDVAKVTGLTLPELSLPTALPKTEPDLIPPLSLHIYFQNPGQIRQNQTAEEVYAIYKQWCANKRSVPFSFAEFQQAREFQIQQWNSKTKEEKARWQSEQYKAKMRAKHEEKKLVAKIGGGK
jgi:hypothetical protein